MQVEAPMDGDDTALNNIEFLCADSEGNIEDAFPLSPGPGWGEWGNQTACNRGDLLVGFRLRVEEEQGDGDDTAANDMEVQCSGGAVLTPPNGGPWGEWGDFMYCEQDNSAVCGASLRIEPPIDGDDTAVNDVKMYCCSLPAAEEESD
jgi:Vitelline membrane outer layer protein I (VOMI)